MEEFAAITEPSYIRYGYFPVDALYNGRKVLLLGIWQNGDKPVAIVKHEGGRIEMCPPTWIEIKE